MIFKWICPNCQHRNDDAIDPVDGPFFTCTCGECGKSFDQEAVEQEINRTSPDVAPNARQEEK